MEKSLADFVWEQKTGLGERQPFVTRSESESGKDHHHPDLVPDDLVLFVLGAGGLLLWREKPIQLEHQHDIGLQGLYD
jgi:hypothetical protein